MTAYESLAFITIGGIIIAAMTLTWMAIKHFTSRRYHPPAHQLKEIQQHLAHLQEQSEIAVRSISDIYDRLERRWGTPKPKITNAEEIETRPEPRKSIKGTSTINGDEVFDEPGHIEPWVMGEIYYPKECVREGNKPAIYQQDTPFAITSMSLPSESANWKYLRDEPVDDMLGEAMEQGEQDTPADEPARETWKGTPGWAKGECNLPQGTLRIHDNSVWRLKINLGQSIQPPRHGDDIGSNWQHIVTLDSPSKSAILNLNDVIDTLRARNKNLSDSTGQWEKRTSELEGKIRNLELERNTRDQSLEVIRKERTEACNKLQDAMKVIAEKNNTIDGLIDKETKALEKLDIARGENHDLVLAVASHENRVKDLTHERDKLETALSEATGGLTTQLKQVEGEREQLKAQVKRLDQALKHKENDLATARGENVDVIKTAKYKPIKGDILNEWKDRPSAECTGRATR